MSPAAPLVARAAFPGRWVWLVAWTSVTVAAVALTTPWDWLPGGSLATADPTAGLARAALAAIDDYRDAAVPVGLASTGLGLLVSVLLGLTSLGSRLVRSLPGRRHRWLHRVVAVATVVGVGVLAVLPLRVVAELLARRAGLSTRSWSSWAADVATSYAVTTAVTAGSLLGLAWLATRTRHWVAPASLGAGSLVLLGSLAYPVVVEPLYASFTPMPSGPLRTSLLQLAARDGIDIDSVLIADASKRTSAVNAYVSGLGPTRRLVVYDTLLVAPRREVRLVVAHELGHTSSDDVLRGTLIGAAAAVTGASALFLLAGSSNLRRRAGLAGSASGSDEGDEPHRLATDPARHTVTAVAGVPLLLALTALGSFAALPLTNAVSRATEARADVHALELTEDRPGFVAMQQRLAVTNLSDPAPPALLQWWFGTHPSTAQRLALAAGWSDLQSRTP